MSAIRKAFLAALTLLVTISGAKAQPKIRTRIIDNTAARSKWVDSVYNHLSQEQKIGQLFMVAAYSGTKNYNDELITRLIDSQQIGGLIFMQGGPIRQAMLTNKYQHQSHVPLLIAMDAEWGLGMRLDSVRSFPRQMMLGATRDTELVFRMGSAIAYQCRRLGVHVDFAPDVDVNNNAGNPVINSRSFGEDKYSVSRLSLAYMRGLQKNGVIACAKHFPGHGNTNVDSHKDLPIIASSLPQLDTLELYPFKQQIAAGIKSIMVAHLEVPALDTTPHVPTTLSKNAVTNLLKNRLGFNGLIFTDALGMVGVTKYFPAGEADLRAFEAGNDILLFSQDVPIAAAKIKNALDSGIIPAASLETSVKKILAAKYDLGLAKWKDIDTTNITNDLNQFVDPIKLQVARAAITVVKDDNQILHKINENMRIGYIGINADSSVLYSKLQDKFNNISTDWIPKSSKAARYEKALENINKYDAAIVAIHNINFTPANNYGLSDDAVEFIAQAGCKSNVLVVLFGNAYASQYFCGSNSVMIGYEDDTITERAASEILLGKIKARGKLPVTACINGKSVCQAPVKPQPVVVKEPTTELKKVWMPAEAGVIEPKALEKLDMFMARNIADGVFPGCRVLAARDGKVFYDKAFGYMRYDKIRPVDTNTLYDMASCTKVLATTISVMRLFEQGKLDLDKTLGDYLPQARGTNKEKLVIRDILLHQAGLKAWIPFYKETVDADGDITKAFYKKKSKGDFTIPVARNLYLRSDYPDTMWSRIYTSPLDNKGKMVYSDLDFYFMAAVVQQITGKTIDKYAEEEFYTPLGLKRTAYNPLSKFDTTEIAPTEREVGFRDQVIHGFVHDPGAAMLGGVSGHAGLFSTAHDVAVIFQMLLNKGIYANKRYFKASTVEMFSAYNSTLSHRGLGFDKPLPDADNSGAGGERCSPQAFGHQGFTGTCAWADPATGIVFVFLSNRVYPSASNTKINKLSVRTQAQDYIYESIGIPVNHDRGTFYKKLMEAKAKASNIKGK